MGEHLSRECLIPLRCACACTCVFAWHNSDVSYVRVKKEGRGIESTLREFLAVFAILRAGASASSVSARHDSLSCRKECSCVRKEKREKRLKKILGSLRRYFPHVSRFILDFTLSLKSRVAPDMPIARITTQRFRGKCYFKRKSHSCRERETPLRGVE